MYCKRHQVCLCRTSYRREDAKNPGLPLKELNKYDDYRYEMTCWDKYHYFYISKDLFSEHGRIRRSSIMHQESKKLRNERENQKKEQKMMQREEHYLVRNILNELNIESVEKFPACYLTPIERRESYDGSISLQEMNFTNLDLTKSPACVLTPIERRESHDGNTSLQEMNSRDLEVTPSLQEMGSSYLGSENQSYDFAS